MQHEIVAAGIGYRLRPVTLDDAELIVELRSTSRSRYLHPIVPDVEAQRRYLADQLERASDWYWVIERLSDQAAEGLVGIYALDATAAHRQAEWGRWILREGSTGALESSMLVYDLAFDVLKLDRLYCRTVAENGPVVAFHDSIGAELVGQVAGAFVLDGAPCDAIEHAMTPERWAHGRPRIHALAARIAQRMVRPTAVAG